MFSLPLRDIYSLGSRVPQPSAPQIVDNTGRDNNRTWVCGILFSFTSVSFDGRVHVCGVCRQCEMPTQPENDRNTHAQEKNEKFPATDRHTHTSKQNDTQTKNVSTKNEKKGLALSSVVAGWGGRGPSFGRV